MVTAIERATELLVAHQRLDIKGCVCGWAELGRSHPQHQAKILAEAGLLADNPIDPTTGSASS